MSGLMSYMGDPAPMERRFSGNVILAPSDSAPASFPSGNLVTIGPIRFAEPNNGNYQLTSPKWTKTTDGKPAGVDTSALNAALSHAGATISEH